MSWILFFLNYCFTTWNCSDYNLTDCDRCLYIFYFSFMSFLSLNNVCFFFFNASFYICLSPLFLTLGEPLYMASSMSSIQYATYSPMYLCLTGIAERPNLIPKEKSTNGWNYGFIKFTFYLPSMYVEFICLLGIK